MVQRCRSARKRNCAKKRNLIATRAIEMREPEYNEKLRPMDTGHVILNVHISAVSGKEEELAEQLRAVLAPTRSEAGCLVYELHRDPQNPAKFMFYE